MSDDFRWYVVHTYSGYENKVASNLRTTIENRKLQSLFQDVKVPTETVEEITDGVTKMVERKKFPGYVFVKMVFNDESWYIVKSIRGCTGFVGPDSEAVPLSETEVEKMGVETRSIEVKYDVGDKVRIIDGSLEDQVGVVDFVDIPHNIVRVIVSMFGGRATPITLQLDQVELLD